MSDKYDAEMDDYRAGRRAGRRALLNSFRRAEDAEPQEPVLRDDEADEDEVEDSK